MGLPLLILRFVATPILGIAIFAGLLLTLVGNNIVDKLLNAEFYTDTIAEQNTYNRIYDDVLLDQKAKDKVQELLGDVKVVSPEDIVGLVRGLLPPEYLQSQVEGAIQRAVAYFNEDSDTLELYLEMGPAIDKIKPTLLDYVDRRIDGIPEADPGPAECNPETVKSVRDGYQEVFRGLAGGRVPASLPSIKVIAEPCRVLIFDSAFPALFADDTLDSRITQALGNSTDDIRAAFVAGDTHGVLKAAARPLSEPLVDDVVAKIRERLDEGDRLNLIRVLAETNSDFTEEQIRVEVADAKELIVQYRALGGTLAGLMLYGGAILLAVLHLPKLSAAMRWPGIFLLVSGGLIFIVGKILESKVVDWLITGVDQITANAPGIPGPAINLISDLVLSFGQQLTQGFAAPAFTVLIVGALLFAASIVLSIVKPFIPGLS
ncbi:MAG: hypothetical protein MK210_13060 [Dehalococcoidia bacterium]|jgi:hypothetical protein|nr:hypothetical protein [Dehalococcoidia bacterium]